MTLGFNVPQTGAYADEGMDELRAYQLAVEHLNGEGDGGLLATFSSKELTGAGDQRQEGRLRQRRHPDQGRRRPRQRQADDRDATAR